MGLLTKHGMKKQTKNLDFPVQLIIGHVTIQNAYLLYGQNLPF